MAEIEVFRARNTTGLAINGTRVTKTKPYGLIQTTQKFKADDEEVIKALRIDVQPVDRWISVKDRLPEIGKSVLIYYPKWDGDEIQVAKLESDGMMFDICGEFNIGTGVVTHWQPLPELPKDGDPE